MNKLLSIAFLTCFVVSIFAQAADALPTRSELAELLDSAEQNRSWFRIHCDETPEYKVGELPAGEYTVTFDALADGIGRFCVVVSSSVQEGYELVAWDRMEMRVLGQVIHNGEPLLPSVAIDGEFPIYLIYDNDLWSVLGIMLDYPTSDITPMTRVSEVLANTNLLAEISSVYEDGRDLVKVILPNPFDLDLNGNNPYFEFYYDPSKDWLLTRSIMSSSRPYSEDYNKRYHNEICVIESEEVDGIWMPTLVKDHQIFYNDPKPVDHVATIRLSDIELEPPVSDEDFTVDISSLPDGAGVVDRRMNISYKIGDTMIYMDGHLNDVGEPIVSEVTSSELVRLMKDAVPMIDPVATEKLSQLENVTFKGVMSRYSTWGFALIGLGLASFGFLLWRRNQV